MKKTNSNTMLSSAALAALLLTTTLTPLHMASAQEEHQGEEHEDGGGLRMSAKERQENGVETARAERRQLSDEALVPGQVTIDLYRSAQITPRIQAQVVERKARLGDMVKKGQPIVTLSSVEMADAQGDVIVATREWERVRELGRDVVSERRYVEAQVGAELARAKVLAYGLTADQAKALAEKQDASRATGLFDLLAPQDGVILSDDFVVGEVVEPGRVLFELTDSNRLWVEAQLSPEQAAHVSVGTPVRVLSDGLELSGKIAQTYQKLDETTRTLPVRIEVSDPETRLRPGQFVNVAVTIGASTQTLAVPSSAIILMDGKPTVFKIEGDELHPTEILAGESRSGWTAVHAGLEVGDDVATSNVFLLKSLIQKSEMGEGHGH